MLLILAIAMKILFHVFHLLIDSIDFLIDFHYLTLGLLEALIFKFFVIFLFRKLNTLTSLRRFSFSCLRFLISSSFSFCICSISSNFCLYSSMLAYLSASVCSNSSLLFLSTLRRCFLFCTLMSLKAFSRSSRFS